MNIIDQTHLAMLAANSRDEKSRATGRTTAQLYALQPGDMFLVANPALVLPTLKTLALLHRLNGHKEAYEIYKVRSATNLEGIYREVEGFRGRIILDHQLQQNLVIDCLMHHQRFVNEMATRHIPKKEWVNPVRERII